MGFKRQLCRRVLLNQQQRANGSVFSRSGIHLHKIPCYSIELPKTYKEYPVMKCLDSSRRRRRHRHRHWHQPRKPRQMAQQDIVMSSNPAIHPAAKGNHANPTGQPHTHKTCNGGVYTPPPPSLTSFLHRRLRSHAQPFRPPPDHMRADHADQRGETQDPDNLLQRDAVAHEIQSHPARPALDQPRQHSVDPGMTQHQRHAQIPQRARPTQRRPLDTAPLKRRVCADASRRDAPAVQTQEKARSNVQGERRDDDEGFCERPRLVVRARQEEIWGCGGCGAGDERQE